MGAGGVPQIYFHPKSYFLFLKTPCKISEPYDNPPFSVTWAEKRNNAVNSGHLVP